MPKLIERFDNPSSALRFARRTRRETQSRKGIVLKFLSCLTLGVLGPVRGETPEAIVVLLRPATVVKGRTVTVGDVADLEGGTPQVRDGIAHLDLAEISGEQSSATINRTPVKLRTASSRCPDIPCPAHCRPRAQQTNC